MLKKNSKAVCDAIVREGGHFYVCGDVQMASDVSDTIEMILKEEAQMTSEGAKNYVLKLRVRSKIIVPIDHFKYAGSKPNRNWYSFELM